MDIFNRISNYASEKGISFEEAALELIREGNIHPRDLQMLPAGTVDDGFHSKGNKEWEIGQESRWGGFVPQ